MKKQREPEIGDIIRRDGKLWMVTGIIILGGIHMHFEEIDVGGKFVRNSTMDLNYPIARSSV